jgi:hypothetical protein
LSTSGEISNKAQYVLRKTQLLLELGILLAQTVSKQVLEALVFFFERDKITEVAAFWRRRHSPLPLIVGLLRNAGLADRTLAGRTTSD